MAFQRPNYRLRQHRSVIAVGKLPWIQISLGLLGQHRKFAGVPHDRCYPDLRVEHATVAGENLVHLLDDDRPADERQALLLVASRRAVAALYQIQARSFLIPRVEVV